MDRRARLPIVFILSVALAVSLAINLRVLFAPPSSPPREPKPRPAAVPPPALEKVTRVEAPTPALPSPPARMGVARPPPDGTAEPERSLGPLWSDLDALLRARPGLEQDVYASRVLDATVRFLGMSGPREQLLRSTLESAAREIAQARGDLERLGSSLPPRDSTDPAVYRQLREAINLPYLRRVTDACDRVRGLLDPADPRHAALSPLTERWMMYLMPGYALR